MKHFLILLFCFQLSIRVHAQKHLGGKLLGKEATCYQNKDFVKREFRKIAVKTGTQDAKADKKIISEYKDLNIALVSWLDLFPPVKDYSDNEIKKALNEKNIDGVISIDVTSDQKVGIYASKETYLELSFTDLETNIKAINFIGRSSLGVYSSLFAPEKTTLKFVRLTYDDLKNTIIP